MMMRFWVGMAMVVVGAGGALADQATADRCAAKLPRQARAIYSASAPLLVKGADGRAVVTEQTRKLVMAGQVDYANAHDLATAAAQCLVLR